MSARDDYPLHGALEQLNGGPSALAEIDALRRWKTEATTVLNYWDIAYEMANIEGLLGESKPTLMLTEIQRLRTDLSRAEALVMNVAMRCVREPDVAAEMVADERDRLGWT